MEKYHDDCYMPVYIRVRRKTKIKKYYKICFLIGNSRNVIKINFESLSFRSLDAMIVYVMSIGSVHDK